MELLTTDRDAGAREVLTDVLQDTRKMRGVIVLRYFDDGTQLHTTSNMSQEEKCFLKTFFDAVTYKWFLDCLIKF